MFERSNALPYVSNYGKTIEISATLHIRLYSTNLYSTNFARFSSKCYKTLVLLTLIPNKMLDRSKTLANVSNYGVTIKICKS